jgi:hypothetical protein
MLILLRSQFASKRIIKVHDIDLQEWKVMLEKIRKRMNGALVHPGEAVGIIGSQCVGGNVTQMTLKSFHFAGNSEKNVTLGVPRINEMVNASKKIKTPSMTIYLRPCVAGNERLVQSIALSLIGISLGSIIKSKVIFYKPYALRDQCHKVFPGINNLVDTDDIFDFHRMVNEAIPDFLPELQMKKSQKHESKSKKRPHDLVATTPIDIDSNSQLGPDNSNLDSTSFQGSSVQSLPQTPMSGDADSLIYKNDMCIKQKETGSMKELNYSGFVCRLVLDHKKLQQFKAC